MGNRKSITVTDCAHLVLSAALCLGTAFVFHPCAQGAEGWMRCHWAGMAVAGSGGALTVLAVMRLFIKDGRVKLGASLAAIPFIIGTALIPGVLIPLCGMKSMRCHTVMRPAVLVVAALLLVTAAADVALHIVRRKHPGRAT